MHNDDKFRADVERVLEAKKLLEDKSHGYGRLKDKPWQHTINEVVSLLAAALDAAPEVQERGDYQLGFRSGYQHGHNVGASYPTPGIAPQDLEKVKKLVDSTQADFFASGKDEKNPGVYECGNSMFEISETLTRLIDAAEPVVPVSIAVSRFAEAMEAELRRNDHKTGWDDEDIGWLLSQSAGNINQAIDNSDSATVSKAIVDAGNYLMMAFDNFTRTLAPYRCAPAPKCTCPDPAPTTAQRILEAIDVLQETWVISGYAADKYRAIVNKLDAPAPTIEQRAEHLCSTCAKAGVCIHLSDLEIIEDFERSELRVDYRVLDDDDCVIVAVTRCGDWLDAQAGGDDGE